MKAKRCQLPSRRAAWRSAAVVGGSVLEVAADAADLGVLEGADELGEPLGLDQAVGVDEGEDLARALGDAAVAGVGDAALRLAQVA